MHKPDFPGTCIAVPVAGHWLVYEFHNAETGTAQAGSGWIRVSVH